MLDHANQPSGDAIVPASARVERLEQPDEAVARRCSRSHLDMQLDPRWGENSGASRQARISSSLNQTAGVT
jgi:hypothetical protein